MNKDYEIINEQIIIKTAIPILSLLEMEIYHIKNRHGKLRMQVIVREEDKEEILHNDWSNTTILVLKKEMVNIPLFDGNIEKLIIKAENQFVIVEIIGIGKTAKLDKEKKKRSFQNPTVTYRQIIKEILMDYENADFIWKVGSDKAIGSPLIQYEETDWEFLIRLCSHFHSILISDLRTCNPEFSFGMTYEKEQSLNELEIIENGFDCIYYKSGCYENGLPRNYTFYLKGKTTENWQMGDFICYESQRYLVYRKDILFRNGELTFTYYVGAKGMYYQKKIYNRTLVGVRLEGIIKKVKEETVYLQLDIDKKGQAEYPWIWAPEINNLCYCMPEIGTKATLYLPTQDEKDGKVILATIKNEKNNVYKNTQNREFITKDYKKIALYPNQLFLESTNKSINIFMKDKTGIELHSNKNTSFIAKGKVHFSAKKVSIVAPLEIISKTKKSNIEICRDFNLYAPRGIRTVGIDSITNKQIPIVKREKEKRIEHWQASYSALAAIPTVDFAKMQENDVIIDIYTAGCVPKVAKGSTTIALSEVMEGEQESKTSFPSAFQSMENYTVKGGYALPEETK